MKPAPPPAPPLKRCSLDLFDRPSTADTGQRNDFDFYETPAFMTRSLLHYHPLPSGSRILEPCAGDGAISRVLQAAGYTRERDTMIEIGPNLTLAIEAVATAAAVVGIYWAITRK